MDILRSTSNVHVFLSKFVNSIKKFEFRRIENIIVHPSEYGRHVDIKI